MKPMLLLMALLMPVAANAAPASKVAWTPERLSFVKNGNPDKGKALAASCAACHGDQGVSTNPAWPSLAAQNANYLYKQLRDYAGGERDHPLMTPIAQSLSEQDSADLAAWFSALPQPENPAVDTHNLDRAEKMVSEGDGKRILPPCFVCHGARGQGEKMDIPALAGQQADYFNQTLLDYKSGQRHNDIYSRMRLIAQQLSDEEIKELAQYYQQLR
ncbi:MAG: cytochrome c4 [Gammaproteobacteria bacterium HGW-Gammaproteobacteria-3]|nr:MAG: cytochrome c4 [Gammaproteobacteria bacterium HGW-Gammaproteobacteria-3]